MDKLLDRDKPKEDLEDYEDIADAINYDYYDFDYEKKKSNEDYEITM